MITGVLLEAKFFGFTELTAKIEELMLASERKVLEPLCRDDVIRALITTPSNYILRFRVSERACYSLFIGTEDERKYFTYVIKILLEIFAGNIDLDVAHYGSNYFK